MKPILICVILWSYIQNSNSESYNNGSLNNTIIRALQNNTVDVDVDDSTNPSGLFSQTQVNNGAFILYAMGTFYLKSLLK